ncbi:hypothetical protein [Corynebacterium sanguinis]|uniref:hypothetical protein n=1 Tax=Corynebacterium sanguinis TaxID=2594913 RepID=UPI00223AF2A6|nr:hypothetical protein [Corynebacterium sanguinis]MCT1596599.1 hypothetical protein [Corynebacterium sanguinis]
MKLRNSLLAVVTATALVSGGVAAPAHAQQPAQTTEQKADPSIGELLQGSSNNESEEEGNGSSNLDKLNAAKTWISVIAAAIGLLGTIITFATKNFGLTLPKLG